MPSDDPRDSTHGAASGGFGDPLELLRRFWAPLGVPVPGAPAGGAAPAAMPTGFGGLPGASFLPPMAFPTTDPAELDKRIADLRSVESWLALNLEMVRTTIQGMEAQKSTLAAFRQMHQSVSDTLQAQAEQVARAADAMKAAGGLGPAKAPRSRSRKPR